MLLPIPRIYLDLDGVIRDFEAGVEKHFNVKFSRDDIQDYRLNFNKVKEKSGLTTSQVWGEMDIDFVSSLPYTPWAKRLLTALEPYKPIILTSPSRTNATGSQNWIRKRLPHYFYEGRYLIGPCKRACANPFSILVDDWSKHTKEFKENGGHSILFPTWQNENMLYKDKPLHYFAKTLKQILIEMFNEAEITLWKDLILDKNIKGLV